MVHPVHRIHASLDQLKRKFPNDLQVICVAAEKLPKVLEFLSKKSLPFDFIFDSTKQLNKVFPHETKPHTIIIDKKGNIQSETYPALFTEKEVNLLLDRQSINIPQKNVSDLTSQIDSTSLFSFKLSNTELGNAHSFEKVTDVRNKRIIKDLSNYIDTSEIVTTYEIKNQNILELYQIALGIPASRFVYAKLLNYINSRYPDKRYNLYFTVSDLIDPNQKLFVNQLNTVFNLRAEKTMIDTTVFELKNIFVDGKNIRSSKASFVSENNGGLIAKSSSFLLKGLFSAKEIAVLIENAIKHPVELNKSLDKMFYDINIDIKSTGKDAILWLPALLNKQGIIIEKVRKKAEFVKITGD